MDGMERVRVFASAWLNETAPMDSHSSGFTHTHTGQNSLSCIHSSILCFTTMTLGIDVAGLVNASAWANPVSRVACRMRRLPRETVAGISTPVAGASTPGAGVSTPGANDTDMPLLASLL